MRKPFICFAALAMIAACNKEESPAPSQGADTITAYIEQETATRTYVDASNNIRWSAGDQIVGFMNSTIGLKYQIDLSSVGKTSATFQDVSESNGNINAGTTLDHNVMYYPYSDGIEIAKSGSGYALDVVLPSEQSYVESSFGNGAMAMAAVSEDDNITFRNVLGGMKLQLLGTQVVTSITLQGNNNEMLSGAAIVTIYTDDIKPTIAMADDASTSVTLDCGNGVELNENTAIDFIIALPPVVFTEGFSVTITDAESNTYTVETDKENKVLRSSLLVMPVVTLESGQGNQPQEADYIDEYGINQGPGIRVGGTVWAPVNCGYHATDYMYGKLYQWGRKYGQGYNGPLNDMNSGYLGHYSDTSVPEISYGPVTLLDGQSPGNVDVFYAGAPEFNYDWVYQQNGRLWNAGTESNPVKTEYDPCPDGWRVPTYSEYRELFNFPYELNNEILTYRFYDYSCSSYVELIPAGNLDRRNGDSYNRGSHGCYWTSTGDNYYSNNLYFLNNYIDLCYDDFGRADGYSVRCVKDDRELIPVESITLDMVALTIENGCSEYISTTILPSNANNQFAHWWSDNPQIATVDQNGFITGVAEGVTIITAMAGMQMTTCEVTVIPKTSLSATATPICAASAAHTDTLSVAFM